MSDIMKNRVFWVKCNS